MQSKAAPAAFCIVATPGIAIPSRNPSEEQANVDPQRFSRIVAILPDAPVLVFRA
jgi:hypothetical protein